MFQVPRRTVALALFALQLVPASLYAARTPTAIRFVSTPTRMAPVPVGSLRGRVVDKESGQPIVAAQVTVVGTSLGALTNNDGVFTITGVAAGQVTVRAARIGYQPRNQVAVVTDNSQSAVNFSLDRAVARLEEVVTTATGEQSRREMGNVVATVKADSVVQTAPVTSVNERKMIASVAAVPSWPSQNGFRMAPTRHTTANMTTGEKKFVFGNGFSTLTEAASLLPP